MSKKGKKPKGKTLNLQDFLSENGGSQSNSIVTKSLSWANECDDDDYANTKIETYSIPTVPRSQRVLDDSTIPQNPPYWAHIWNLPYDLGDGEISEYFEEVTASKVLTVRLPRDDGDSGRMRGSGFIEFADRDGLIAAVSASDLQLRNRKIRIDVSGEPDFKRGGNRGRYDNFGSSDNRDWRGSRGSAGSAGGASGAGGAGGGGSSSQENGGNWRSGDRPKMESPPAARRNNDRYNNRGFTRDEAAPITEERPRIKLQPRTVPLEFDPRISEPKEDAPPPRPKPKPVPSALIFGDAKPVDTASKDREIEERMERERGERDRLAKEKHEQERLRRQEETEEKERTVSETVDSAENVDSAEISENAGDDQESAEQSNGDEAEEKSTAPEKAEVISWRRKPDDDDKRSSSPTRKRFSPDRRRRLNDDRRGPPRDNRRDNRNDKRDFNRDREYQRSDRDLNKGDNYNRDNRNVERSNRNYNNNRETNRGPPTRRSQPDEQQPDEAEPRMPKLQPDVKPKLQMSNTYEIFNDETSE